MMLGIPNSEGVRQLWGRSFANLLGYSLGVPSGQVGNDPNTSGDVPPESYGSWGGLAFAPPAAAAATAQGASGFTPIFPDLSLAEEDGDGDGVPEGQDTCPGISNGGQQDLDGDGHGDACDLDADGDGLKGTDDEAPNDTDNDGAANAADTDDDGDGAPDAADNCPVVPNGDQENTDGDGAGDACDPDDDDDSFPDYFENAVGSDPLAGANLPEFLGFVDSCGDAADNDGDGDPDGADSGCQDSDGDTTPDSLDNCPGIASINVTDTDEDGVGDRCETAGEERTWGDIDCSGVVDAVDGLKLLRHDSGLSVAQGPDCPEVGTAVSVAQAAAVASSLRRWGW